MSEVVTDGDNNEEWFLILNVAVLPEEAGRYAMFVSVSNIREIFTEDGMVIHTSQFPTAKVFAMGLVHVWGFT